MAQLNYMGQNWGVNPWNTNMNGSNMSLNLPASQNFYPPDQQQMWMNSWGQPGMYPYPMPPNMMNGKNFSLYKFQIEQLQN